MSVGAPRAAESVEDLFARFGPKYRIFVALAGMVASFTMVLTGTMVNVAVPNVMGAYGVGQEHAQLMTTVFLVAMTTNQLLNAWVVSVFGQRIGFCGTLLLFAVGSLIGALGEDFAIVVFGRALQGAASGIIQPLVMVTFFQIFPAERRGFAMGLYGMGLTLALALGPPTGGLVIDGLGWRYIFLVPLPLVGLAFLFGLVFMPSNLDDRRPRFNWAGYLLLTTTLYCLVTGLSNGQKLGWVSDYTAGHFLGALIAGSVFLWTQAASRDPLLDLSLFRNGRFAAAVMIAFVFGAGNFATTYAYPVFGQLVQGLSATDAGMLLMPAGLVVVAMLPICGRLADRITPHYAIMFGLFMFFIGTVLMRDVDANTPYWNITLFAGITRFGMGFIMPFIMHTALVALPADRLNTGGGTVNFCRQLGGALGTNMWVVFFELRTGFHSSSLNTTQIAANAASREMLNGVAGIFGQAGVPAAIHQPGALYYLGQVVHAQASTLGFQDGFLAIAAMFLLALIPAWMLGRADARGR